MPDDPQLPIGTGRILVVLRPSSDLGAAESRARLRPLRDTPEAAPLGAGAEPRGFVAQPPGGAAPCG